MCSQKGQEEPSIEGSDVISETDQSYSNGESSGLECEGASTQSVLQIAPIPSSMKTKSYARQVMRLSPAKTVKKKKSGAQRRKRAIQRQTAMVSTKNVSHEMAMSNLDEPMQSTNPQPSFFQKEIKAQGEPIIERSDVVGEPDSRLVCEESCIQIVPPQIALIPNTSIMDCTTSKKKKIKKRKSGAQRRRKRAMQCQAAVAEAAILKDISLEKASDLSQLVKMVWRDKTLEFADTKEQLMMIQRLNPSLCTGQWTIVKEYVEDVYTRRVVLMDTVSAEVIKTENYTLFSGLGYSKFKLLNNVKRQKKKEVALNNNEHPILTVTMTQTLSPDTSDIKDLTGVDAVLSQTISGGDLEDSWMFYLQGEDFVI